MRIYEERGRYWSRREGGIGGGEREVKEEEEEERGR